MRTSLVVLYVVVCTACRLMSHSAPRTLPETPVVDLFDNETEFSHSLRRAFASSGFNFDVRLDQINLARPIDGPIKLLSRFGTPTFARLRLFNDSDELYTGYFHDGLDVARAENSQRLDVFSPVSGMATLVFDASPEQVKSGDVNGYSTAIFVHDAKSRVVVELLHVSPVNGLFKPGTFVPVKVGQLIGQLAEVDATAVAKSEDFRHVHLALLDFKTGIFIDPSPFLSGYRDTLAPVIEGAYAYDETAQKVGTFPSGKFDVVVSAYDQDESSPYHQEIFTISATIKDDRGTEIFRLRECQIKDLMFEGPFREAVPATVIDVSALIQEMGQRETNILGDNMKFGYVITNMKVDASGRCHAEADQDGFAVVSSPTASFVMDVVVADHFGNRRESSFTIP